MRLLHSSMFVSLSLVLACGNSEKSTAPDAGKYDGYYSENPKTSGGDAAGTSAAGGGTSTGKTAKSSEMTTTRALAGAAAMKRIRSRRPAVKGGKKKVKPSTRAKRAATAGVELGLDGFLPTAATAGSLVEVYGTALDQKGLEVRVGGRSQRIVSQREDRLVFRFSGGRGKISLGKKSGRRSRRFVAAATSNASLETLVRGFGHRTNADRGLVGNVYTIDGEVTELPTFEGVPAAVIAVDNLDFSSANFNGTVAGTNEWFGVHYRGSLNITEAGDYEFCLESDDGAQLYLDESLIINNDGVHEAAEVCSSFAVDPGEYQFDTLYFQAAQGPLTLKMTWSRDGGTKEAIPASAFFPPEDVADIALRANASDAG